MILPPVDLRPVAASMSSIRLSGNGADKCIDGITDGPDSTPGDMCHTLHDAAPWLALDYGVSRVSVARVVIVDRKSCGSKHECMGRTKNVEVRLSDELPTSATSMFSGGDLLGTFAGPAFGQQVEIQSGPGWAEKYGRYVIVQMDNGGPLNLKEVTAFGGVHRPVRGKQFIQFTSNILQQGYKYILKPFYKFIS